MTNRATLAELRARDLSPWRRAFHRRVGRIVWFTALAASAVAGAAVAWALLHLPYAGRVRSLVPANPAPDIVVEVRDAARIADIDWFRDALLAPLWQEVAANPDYSTLVGSIAADDADDPWRAVGAALGRDAVVAVYPAELGARPFILIGVPSPLARVELARMALLQRWPRAEGLTHVAVPDASITVHYATRGRLVLASNDPSLVTDALEVLYGTDGFLTPGDDPDASLFARRAAAQSDDRSGSFYVRTEAGDVLGEVSLYAGDWSATVWAPARAVTPDPDAVDSARAIARSAPAGSAAVFWHAGITMRAARTILAESMELTWAPEPARPSATLPLVVTIPGGDGAGGLLPEVAVTVATPSAQAVRDALARGKASVRFKGSAVKVTLDGDETRLGFPLGFGLRYPIHVRALAGALTFATSARALGNAVAGGLAPVTVSTQRRADLFQLVANGPALHTAVARGIGLATLAGGAEASALGGARRIMPLLARSELLTANGLATPDGFRVDIHASVVPTAADPKASAQ